VLVSGCGQREPVESVKTFTDAAPTAAGQEVLRSIATYRTAKPKAACELITARFLKTRYRDNLPDCLFVVGQAKRELPADAEVKSVTGTMARVEVQEVVNVRSEYAMKNEGGVWKVDAIVEAR
jgi:hypothetical protein